MKTLENGYLVQCKESAASVISIIKSKEINKSNK